VSECCARQRTLGYQEGRLAVWKEVVNWACTNKKVAASVADPWPDALADPEFVAALDAGIADIKAGRVHKFDSTESVGTGLGLPPELASTPPDAGALRAVELPADGGPAQSGADELSVASPPSAPSGHRFDTPHDCFEANCKSLGREVADLTAQVVRLTAVVDALRELDRVATWSALGRPEVAPLREALHALEEA
jgi:hypothetical protein